MPDSSFEEPEAEWDSHGEFQLDWQAALEKLGQHGLTGPVQALWKLVQAAVAWNSPEFHVVHAGSQLRVFFRIPPETSWERTLQEAVKGLLSAAGAPERELLIALAFLRKFAPAALSLWSDLPRAIPFAGLIPLHSSRLEAPSGCNFGVVLHGDGWDHLREPFATGVFFAPLAVYWNARPLGLAESLGGAHGRTPFFDMERWRLLHFLNPTAFLFEYHRRSPSGYGVRPLGSAGSESGCPENWTYWPDKAFSLLRVCQGAGPQFDIPGAGRKKHAKLTVYCCDGSFWWHIDSSAETRIFPVVNGVFLEPVAWPELGLPATLVAALESPETDLGGFRLRQSAVESALLPRARELAREALACASERRSGLHRSSPPHILKFAAGGWLAGAALSMWMGQEAALLPVAMFSSVAAWLGSVWWQEQHVAPARTEQTYRELDETLRRLSADDPTLPT